MGTLTPFVFSRGGTLLPCIYADACAILMPSHCFRSLRKTTTLDESTWLCTTVRQTGQDALEDTVPEGAAAVLHPLRQHGRIIACFLNRFQ